MQDKLNYKIVARKRGFLESLYLIEILRGMWITIKHLFQKKVTIEYPEERRVYSPVFRGRHILTKDKNGNLKCVACELCAIICPSFAIKVVPGECSLPMRERQPEIYEINMMRCIFCGLCVEACPEDAIRMTWYYELADDDRKNLIYDKEKLMKEPPQPPWGKDERITRVASGPPHLYKEERLKK